MRSSFQLFVPFFLLAFLLTACHTAQKFVESGDYDSAIDFCVQKLQGKPKKKIEYVQGLEVAFQKAQSRDLATIDQLMATDRPENWERINQIHRIIRNRQNKIAPLLPLSDKDGYQAKFAFVNIEKLENESCEKAAAYLYDRAQTSLSKAERGDKQAARDAYYDLVDLGNRYFHDYKDKAQMMQQARTLGTSYVLFEVKNQSDKVLPKAFAERILAIGKRDLDSEWKSYYFAAAEGIQFDYKAIFKIRQIDISPERVQERQYIDEKEIEDGYDYVLDAKGNVMKDTLGNDVKVKRYARIRAFVTEVHQSKGARLTGFVEVHDAYRNTLLGTRDLGTEVLFDHYASTFSGDQRALTNDSCNRIGGVPVSFPRDEDMLVQAADRLKPDLRDELRRNSLIF